MTAPCGYVSLDPNAESPCYPVDEAARRIGVTADELLVLILRGDVLTHSEKEKGGLNRTYVAEAALNDYLRRRAEKGPTSL